MTMIWRTPWQWAQRILSRHPHRAAAPAPRVSKSHTPPRPEANLVGLQARWVADTIHTPDLGPIPPGTTGTVTEFVEADSYRTLYQITFPNGATHTTALPAPHLVELMPPSNHNYLGWTAQLRQNQAYPPGSALHTGSLGTVIRFEVGGTGHRAYVLHFPAEGIELTTELPAPDTLDLAPPHLP